MCVCVLAVCVSDDTNDKEGPTKGRKAEERGRKTTDLYGVKWGIGKGTFFVHYVPYVQQGLIEVLFTSSNIGQDVRTRKNMLWVWSQQSSTDITLKVLVWVQAYLCSTWCPVLVHDHLLTQFRNVDRIHLQSTDRTMMTHLLCAI